MRGFPGMGGFGQMPKKKEIPKLLAEEGTKFRKGVNIAYRTGLNIWDYSKKSLWVVATVAILYGIPVLFEVTQDQKAIFERISKHIDGDVSEETVEFRPI